MSLMMTVEHRLVSRSARYNRPTYPYLQDGDHDGTVKLVYCVAGSQNYCQQGIEEFEQY